MNILATISKKKIIIETFRCRINKILTIYKKHGVLFNSYVSVAIVVSRHWQCGCYENSLVRGLEVAQRLPNCSQNNAVRECIVRRRVRLRIEPLSVNRGVLVKMWYTFDKNIVEDINIYIDISTVFD